MVSTTLRLECRVASTHFGSLFLPTILSPSLPYLGLCKFRHNCTHFTCWQSNVQNSPSEASTVHELRTFRCSSWIYKKAKEPEIKLPTYIWIIENTREFQKKISTSASYIMLKPLTLRITTNCGKTWE